ncbi:RNA-directed DNA polymerase, eukaryota, reverse transcriptase zinc-binding domain protein [Tanacetum coccineum]
MWDPHTFVKVAIWCDESFIIVKEHLNAVRNEDEWFDSIFSHVEADHFNSFINSSSLIDLPIGGHLHTWMNKPGTKLSNFNHFLIFEDVLEALPDIHITALDRLWSDHNPILLYVNKSDFGPTPFKNYILWLLHDSFDDLIKTKNPLDRDALERHVLLDEIKTAVWECGSNKAHVFQVLSCFWTSGRRWRAYYAKIGKCFKLIGYPSDFGKRNNTSEKVNIARVNNVTTARPKAVVSAAGGNRENTGNPQYTLLDQGIFDSGCSRHMTGNKSFLIDYQEIDGGFVAFGGSPKGDKLLKKTECLVLRPFPLSEHTSTSLGELVHLDLWGPYRVVSKEGHRMVFMDEETSASALMLPDPYVFRGIHF